VIPRESIEAVLDYLEAEEAADFEDQFGDDRTTVVDPERTHIYSHICAVRDWLSTADRTDAA
jgi:hypothetical protein